MMSFDSKVKENKKADWGTAFCDTHIWLLWCVFAAKLLLVEIYGRFGSYHRNRTMFVNRFCPSDH